MSKALGSRVWMSLFSGLVCLLGMATAAADPALHGRWSFDDEGETRFSEFFSDGRAVMDGDPFQYRASDGQLVLIYQSIELPGQYQIAGNRLTISMFDEVTVYTRVGAAPTRVQPSSSANPRFRPPDHPESCPQTVVGCRCRTTVSTSCCPATTRNCRPSPVVS
ncbi:MAG: hypothetical protein IPK97_05635 [Ahniella sp.]|nr:hypothetical protein [Ahniella sp.]